MKRLLRKATESRGRESGCGVLVRLQPLAWALCVAASAVGCHTAEPVAGSGSNGVGEAIIGAGYLVVTMADWAWEQLTRDEQAEVMKNFASATDSEILAAATSAAQTNVMTGHWRVCRVYAPGGQLAGLSKEEGEGLHSIPLVPLPAATSQSLSNRIYLYAETYNREFVRQFLMAAGGK